MYANYDAIKDEDGEHHAILLCCEGFMLKMIPKNSFFDFLNEVAVNGFEWSVEVLSNYLKRYDGMFVLEEIFDSIVSSKIKYVWESNSYL